VRLPGADACTECGACQKNCPFAAIEVEEGVGCAAAILIGLLTGTEPTCG
jgi:ferredoxin